MRPANIGPSASGAYSSEASSRRQPQERNQIKMLSELRAERFELIKSSNPTVKHIATLLKNFEDKRLSPGGITESHHVRFCEKVARAIKSLKNPAKVLLGDEKILEELDLDLPTSPKLNEEEFKSLEKVVFLQLSGAVEAEIGFRTREEQKMMATQDAAKKRGLFGLFKSSGSSKMEQVEAPREWKEHGIDLLHHRNMVARMFSHALTDLLAMRVIKDINTATFKYHANVIGKAAAMLAGKEPMNETILAQAGLLGPDEKISPKEHEMIEQYRNYVLSDYEFKEFDIAPDPALDRLDSGKDKMAVSKKDEESMKALAELYMKIPSLKDIQGHPHEAEVVKNVSEYHDALVKKGYSSEMVVGIAASLRGHRAIKVLDTEDIEHWLPGTHWQKTAAAVAEARTQLLNADRARRHEKASAIPDGKRLINFIFMSLPEWYLTSWRDTPQGAVLLRDIKYDDYRDSWRSQEELDLRRKKNRIP